MTSIANLWSRFIAAFLAPFVKVKQDHLKLLHAIESDKQSAQQRHLETILDSQANLVKEMNHTVSETSGVLKDWLEGFHKLPTGTGVAPPVNNDERMWRIEMESLAKERGKALTDDMSSYDIEAFITNGFKDL
jgi:hypothetical protein